MADGLRWEGVDDMMRRLQEYNNRIMWAVKQVAQYWAAVLEEYMKKNAPWTDRTANARQSLHTWVEELSNDTIRLYCSHGVYYGIFLETKWAGRFGVIWSSIQRHLPEIQKMLQRIFS